MSNKRDLQKALRDNGFKIVPSGKVKHLVYSNGDRIVRLHLGGTMSDGLFRKVLGQIRRGSVRDLKAQPNPQPGQEARPQ